jgi:hypothetical protein
MGAYLRMIICIFPLFAPIDHLFIGSSHADPALAQLFWHR